MCVCAAEKKQKMKERGRATGEKRNLEEKLCGGDLWGRWAYVVRNGFLEISFYYYYFYFCSGPLQSSPLTKILSSKLYIP